MAMESKYNDWISFIKTQFMPSETQANITEGTESEITPTGGQAVNSEIQTTIQFNGMILGK